MDLMELVVKISAESSSFDSAIKSAEGSASSFHNTAISKIGGGLKAAAKIGVAAIGAAATAIGALTAKAVAGYSEYQQMEGGIKKLYGNMGMSLEEYAKSVGQSTDTVKSKWQSLEKAQNMVLQNASKAYATAGMSANQYMEAATSFSASLISSLGGDTVEAARLTDEAMKAMSDNWNTFGGDLNAIQGTFQSLARGNYAMLDNLKLGRLCQIAEYKPCEYGETLMLAA